jgi:hypothetical protein
MSYPSFTMPDPVGAPTRPVTGLPDTVDPITPGSPAPGFTPPQQPPPPTFDQPPAQAPGGSQPGEVDPLVEQAALMGRPETITLVSGRRVRVNPLRTRELLKLVNIVLGGVGHNLGGLNLNADEDPEVFMWRFAGLAFTAMLSNSDEAIALIRMVCEPEGKISGRYLDRAVRDRNKALDEELDEELRNPHPDDTITIVECLARNNSDDMRAWGKRLAGMWRIITRSKNPASPTSPASTASAA